MALPNNPQTRKEMYLSNMAGQGTALPSEPHTREEEYLDYIAKNGGGGGTGEGDMTKAVYDDDLAVASAGGIADYVAGAITGKVDKVQGKGLSTNDYDDSAKAIVDNVTTALDGKISKSNTAGLVKNDGTIDTTTTGAVAANTSAISAIKDGQSINSFADTEDALALKAGATNFSNTDFTVITSVEQETGKTSIESVSINKANQVLEDVGNPVTSGAVYTALANKVDKVAGKGLSTNDYDDTEKAKVAGAFPRSEQAVLGAKNIWDDSIALSSNASATVTKTTDGYAVQTNTTANSGGQFNQTPLRTRYTPFGNITVSFEYKSDIACAGYIGKSDVTLATDWTKVSYSVDGSTMGAICFYNRDTTKTPLIEMRNMMITLATDTDPSFVPPAMTNKELTENIAFPSASTMTTGTLVKSGDTARTRDVVGGYKKIKNTVFVDIEATANMTMAFSKTFPELDNWGIISNMPTPVHRTALTAYFVHENTIYAGFAEIRKTDNTIHMLAPTLTLVDGDKIYIRGTYEA